MTSPSPSRSLLQALADRVIRLASMGLGPGAAVLGVDRGAGIRTFDASSPHPATLRGSGVGGGVPAAGRRTGVGSDGSSTTSSRLGGIVPGLGAGGMAPARDSTLAAYAGMAATARAGHTLSLGMGGGRSGGGGGGSPGAASSASGSSTYASGYDREPSPAAGAPAAGVGFTLSSPGRVRGGGGGGGAALGAAGIENADAGTRKLLSVLRDALVKQGGTGIAAIGRRFRIVDDDGACACVCACSLLCLWLRVACDLGLWLRHACCGAAASSAAGGRWLAALGLGRASPAVFAIFNGQEAHARGAVVSPDVSPPAVP
jgi:hypothetical protein